MNYVLESPLVPGPWSNWTKKCAWPCTQTRYRKCQNPECGVEINETRMCYDVPECGTYESFCMCTGVRFTYFILVSENISVH